ncbi:MAG: hypothetical protein AB1352_03420 [Patescibacteria group bacterium]
MCVQAYYPTTEYDLELDLLAEIKQFGIAKWKEMVEQKRENILSGIATSKIQLGEIPDDLSKE